MEASDVNISKHNERELSQLCYVKRADPCEPDVIDCFFTSDYHNQRGINWDQSPYHILANEPKPFYYPDYYRDDVEQKSCIYVLTVRRTKNVLLPCEYKTCTGEVINSNDCYSVDQINTQKLIPWIRVKGTGIYGGETINVFRHIVHFFDEFELIDIKKHTPMEELQLYANYQRN